jgi:hypothetical protein
VGDRDYYAQETCHLLLQLPFIKSTIILSLDGSRQVEDQLEEGYRIVTKTSILDHHIQRPDDEYFDNMTLLHFALCRKNQAHLLSIRKCGLH